MKRLTYKVTFESDVVLPSTSNTEGNIGQLDFIPGSNFLGMVAQSYDAFSDSFAVFHSGAVRFGDATLLHDDKATYKMPLSFFHEKLNASTLVNHHLVKDFSAFKQLKQKRAGYITGELEEVGVAHNYAQKSAYNKKERRSLDGSMYGYASLPAGLTWCFSVTLDESILPEDEKRLREGLLGTKRLGKSKSAQYGRVRIEEHTLPTQAEENSTANAEKELVLYAKSRLALVDDEGQATYDLRYLLQGLSEANIVWEKCQLKTSTFTPYHGKMQTKCYERLVINAGSVLVLKEISPEQQKALREGVGVYLSEGFGELLCNPGFLAEESFTFKTISKIAKHNETVKPTHPTAMFLQARRDEQKQILDEQAEVEAFVEKYTKLFEDINKSQWGEIRSICNSNVKEFEGAIEEYISSGKVTWSPKQREVWLRAIKGRKTFAKQLSMQMSRRQKSETGDKNEN
ncbi:hypothetical protein [Sulfurovum sp.]|uniref:hypothetical protein n=1 Tax=Sulfurovum sp. TaxID=1969726 RepID=UPI0025EE8CC9|nr:hypothetical protein [Sulfurovum sp.]